MTEPLARALSHRLPAPTVVSSAEEFLSAKRDASTLSFVDSSALATIKKHEGSLPTGYIIAICEETIHSAIAWLNPHPWLSHVMNVGMLEHPMLHELLKNVLGTLEAEGKPRLLDWVGPEIDGRRIRLTHASTRADRLDRVSEFFESKGAGTRTVQQLRDCAEELLTNAFYDAPVAAGVLKLPISRVQDVSLPEDRACDLSYGLSEELAIVRVRDPFGSLTRRRLVEVLARCARTDMKVQVDESMGGAGLGLWRVFSVASFVAVSVVKGQNTDVLVGIGKRSSGQRPFAFHLFFNEKTKSRRFWRLFEEDTDKPGVNKSVNLVPK